MISGGGGRRRGGGGGGDPPDEDGTAQPPELGGSEGPDHPRSLLPGRARARAAFAALLEGVVRDAAARGVFLVPRWRARLGLGDSSVRRWMDISDPRPLACGDLHALDDESFDLVMDAWRAAREAGRAGAPAAARDPAHELLLIAVRLGDAARAVVSALTGLGVASAAGWAAVAHAFASIETEARRARLACLAARDAATTPGRRR